MFDATEGARPVLSVDGGDATQFTGEFLDERADRLSRDERAAVLALLPGEEMSGREWSVRRIA